MPAIWWVRRDLRLRDNPALQAAISASEGVVPLFIIDPALAKGEWEGRNAFLFQGLQELHVSLQALGSGLVIRHGNPAQVLPQVLSECAATMVFAEEDFTPTARKRDAALQQSLPLTLIHGQTVHHPLLPVKADGSPYTVYTPFSKMWKSLLPSNLEPIPAPVALPRVALPGSDQLPTFDPSDIFPAGEKQARQRLHGFARNAIHQYANERDRMDLDGTSSLSPYLRFGMLSLRQAAAMALLAQKEARQTGQDPRGAEVWLNELIWREFYINILYHFPHVAKTAFNPNLRSIPWRNNPVEFKAWQEGRTGMPIVDAAMRQLRATGWMHNRARMIVASYLVKDLLIDWRWGERWFWRLLLDADPAANNGGWQWTAGTGTDAAPYFRVFNPVLQAQKFDPRGAYVRKWVPELAKVDDRNIHTPWLLSPMEQTLAGCRLGSDYPLPIVDHAEARDRVLLAYKRSADGSKKETP